MSYESDWQRGYLQGLQDDIGPRALPQHTNPTGYQRGYARGTYDAEAAVAAAADWNYSLDNPHNGPF